MQISEKTPEKLGHQLLDCAKLLGKEYTSLNITLEAVDSRNKIKSERKENPILSKSEYKSILNEQEEYPRAGQYIPSHELIRLYLFNINSKNTYQYLLEIVATLFHEIRHAWQTRNGMYLDEQESTNLITSLEEYLQQPSERDAFRFQADMMNKYKEDICTIIQMPAVYGEYRLQQHIAKHVYS